MLLAKEEDKEGGRTKIPPSTPATPVPLTSRGKVDGTRGGMSAKRTSPSPQRRLSRSTAVSIICGENGPSYAEALKKARDVSWDFGETMGWRTVTGSLLIEMPGPGMAEKPDLFAERLKEVFRDIDVRDPSVGLSSGYLIWTTLRGR